jgi:thiosulfate/3-mercaptopyruvate sulfurtransferase
MKNIINKEWLKERLNSPNLIILDCRFSLGKPESGRLAYQASHLPGAVYCHLEENLSGPVLVHGGRHPLPDLTSFQTYLENAGIGNDTVVVAYDNGEGAFASRLWWLLKYVGHEEVYVLNGGFKEWEVAGYPVDAQIANPPKATYEIRLQSQLMATYEEVKRIVDNKLVDAILIDSREPKRYLGLEEPIDKVAGRIPGSVNKFWNDGMEEGHFKSLDDQKQRFSDIKQDDSLIVYCGSGVTAAPNYLILHELGYSKLKLYVGSYSDWISYNEQKVEKN